MAGFQLPINTEETTSSTGTGNIALSGAIPGARALSATLSDGDETLWTLKPDGSEEREVHRSAWTQSTNTLARSASTLIYSTTGGLINLAAGTHRVSIGAVPNPPTAINAQTGTSYTLALTDQSLLVTLDNAAAITVTVPAEASVAFPIGAIIALQQKGAGQVTVAGAGGVTVNSDSGKLNLAAQYCGAVLIKTGTDVWWLAGRLA